MGCFTARHYDQVKDYLHPQLHSFVNYCKQGNLIDLPLYHGCDKKKIKMEVENWLTIVRAINALVQLITIIGKKLKINTK